MSANLTGFGLELSRQAAYCAGIYQKTEHSFLWLQNKYYTTTIHRGRQPFTVKTHTTACFIGGLKKKSKGKGFTWTELLHHNKALPRSIKDQNGHTEEGEKRKPGEKKDQCTQEKKRKESNTPCCRVIPFNGLSISLRRKDELAA